MSSMRVHFGLDTAADEIATLVRGLSVLRVESRWHGKLAEARREYGALVDIEV